MDYIIKKFAQDIDKDKYNDFSYNEAYEFLTRMVNDLGYIPNFILEGDIVAFRCEYALYTPKEVLNTFSYLGGTEEEQKELLEDVIADLKDKTNVYRLKNGNFVIQNF